MVSWGNVESKKILAAEIVALRGYQPLLHNLATEPLGNRNALVAKAVPAPIWAKALLAAVAGLHDA